MTTKKYTMIDFQQLSELINKLKPDIVGTVGALIAAIHSRKENKDKIDFIVFVASGMLCVNLFTDLAVSMLNLQQSNAPSIGFVIGLFSGSLIASIWRSLSKIDWAEIIRSRFGGPR